MKCTPLAIPDVMLIEPRVFVDDRGYFMETWNRQAFGAVGLEVDFVQDNLSVSQQGVLRGLHYQIRHPQGKLVQVVLGEVFDVAVDLRQGSPHFGQWVGQTLSAANKRLMWIPPGFAHAFYVTSAQAMCLYKCTAFYAPDHERSLRWDDPTLGIEWPLVAGQAPALSGKDAVAPGLKQAEVFP